MDCVSSGVSTRGAAFGAGSVRIGGFFLLRVKQLPNIYAYRVCNILQSRDGGSIDASLHKSNETNGVVRLFREFFLGEIRREAEMGDILAEHSIEMGHAARVKELVPD